ncbi:MAG: bifunctional precorrin-2 dehydrogenase/sirohydrochlorin ferrochelatase [Acidaminococcaceae bacterium]|nr:bifunctional precorrin-2 dehydrogenase/sirohydrochlorin ferrochelatase [Acidaminococcaceae bacterium]
MTKRKKYNMTGVCMAYNQFRYTVQLNMENRRCAVIGGGSVALRKIRSLLEAGAAVTVIAPDILPEIGALQEQCPALTLYRRGYEPGDLTGAFLVIAATDDRSINAAVAQEARKQNCLLNVTDDPEAGNFSVAGTYDNGSLHFSAATGGNPRLTHLLLEDLQQQYGDDMAAFCAFLDGQRKTVKQSLPNARARQDFWRQTLTLQLLQDVRQGRLQQAKEIIINAVNRIRSES